MTFTVIPAPAKANWPDAALASVAQALLDLQAGGVKNQVSAALSNDLVTDVMCSGEVDESDHAAWASASMDDEAVITVGDDLLAKLQDAS